MEDKLMTPSEFARRIGRSTDWVRRALRDGKIRHTWTPLGRLVYSSEVERVRSSLTTRPTWRERQGDEAGEAGELGLKG